MDRMYEAHSIVVKAPNSRVNTFGSLGLNPPRLNNMGWEFQICGCHGGPWVKV